MLLENNIVEQATLTQTLSRSVTLIKSLKEMLYKYLNS